MSQGQDMEAIASYMAGARGGLQGKLAAGTINVDQARRGEGIAMDFAQWYANLGWYDKNMNGAVLNDAKARRNQFNAAVSPRESAWVEAAAADIPEAKKTYAFDKKTGDVVHKKTGTAIKQDAKTAKTVKGGKGGVGMKGGGKASMPEVIDTLAVTPKPPPDAKKLADAKASGKLSPFTIAAGAGLIGVGLGAAIAGPPGAMVGGLIGLFGGSTFAPK